MKLHAELTEEEIEEVMKAHDWVLGSECRRKLADAATRKAEHLYTKEMAQLLHWVKELQEMAFAPVRGTWRDTMLKQIDAYLQEHKEAA